MSNDIPNFNLLAVFSAVMEQGSLSKAADHLNTNQSTISTALGRLKNEIGQELFVRSGRGVVPTAYSQSLYEQVKIPIQELNGVFQGMTSFDESTTERKFVVSAPEHLQWLLLNRFAQLPNQGISLEVYDQPVTDDQVHEDLLTQKFDAMIDIVLPEHPSTVSEKLYDGEFVIVCRSGHPRIKGEITEAQYLSEKHAVLDRTRRQLRSLSHYTSLDLSPRKIVFHGSSLFSNLLLCSQSDYITVVPLSMAIQFQERLDLQLFKPPFDYQPITHYLIWLKKQNHDPAHKWFREEIINTSDEMSKVLHNRRLAF
ncbi:MULTISPECIES: LysR family transcriptional regulator [Vibrio]|jgi:DNA-binding transcriptional LysR family regulator|uniref:LysR family transcriptional regulator n=1 Tax=Vibrio TaxID=662 RepID=UPI0002E5025D|nr:MULTISPECIES: LysR family transcriptional regulator [Vibrio]MCF7502625.1 LysR family transcriptional regulator [Vibrio sp. L3-7]OED63385.1 LysR family transcriptional regulator [Vibrio splendidus ZS-139]TVU64281.1 LysR family transcriptional regulator [Vibrio atlanticus]TVU78871.1 LysR family transcriptional regulator [Vibrio tasmaniensis]